MFRHLIPLLFIFFPLTACVPATPYPTPIASPAVAPSLTPAASVTVALENATALSAPTVTPTAINTKTYHNTIVGFNLDYPQGWVIDTRNEATGTVILWSRKVGGPGTDGVPADVVKIDIVNPAISVQSLEELAVWEKQIIADSNHTVLQEQPVQLPSGLVAVLLHGSGMGEAMALLTMINNQPLIVAGYGDLSRFMGVVQTLRPAPPTSQLIFNFDYPAILRAPVDQIPTQFQAGDSPFIYTWLAFAWVGLPTVNGKEHAMTCKNIGVILVDTYRGDFL